MLFFDWLTSLPEATYNTHRFVYFHFTQERLNKIFSLAHCEVVTCEGWRISVHQKELEMKKAEGWSERHAQACEGQRAVVWMGAVVYSHQTHLQRNNITCPI